MKEIITAVKIIAIVPLVILSLLFFSMGIFCLYGGPCGNAWSANALIGAASSIGLAGVMSGGALVILRFDRVFLLLSLILHEAVLVLFFAIMVIATIFSKAIPQIMVHPIVLFVLLAGGYGIFKTAKAIKACRC